MPGTMPGTVPGPHAAGVRACVPGELLGVCLQLLHAEFIATVRAKLEPTAATHQEGTLGGIPWQSLELVCFVMRVLHAELKNVLSVRARDEGRARAKSRSCSSGRCCDCGRSLSVWHSAPLRWRRP